MEPNTQQWRLKQKGTSVAPKVLQEHAARKYGYDHWNRKVQRVLFLVAGPPTATAAAAVATTSV